MLVERHVAAIAQHQHRGLEPERARRRRQDVVDLVGEPPTAPQ
jgi:hypothetical protein